METQFQKRLEALINEHSMENGSDTPDFILARYLQACLDNFDAAVKERELWYGREKHVEEMSTEEFNSLIDLQPIDLDNTEPMIDYDSTGFPPENLRNQPTTGNPPPQFPSTTSKEGPTFEDGV